MSISVYPGVKSEGKHTSPPYTDFTNSIMTVYCTWYARFRKSYRETPAEDKGQVTHHRKLSARKNMCDVSSVAVGGVLSCLGRSDLMMSPKVKYTIKCHFAESK